MEICRWRLFVRVLPILGFGYRRHTYGALLWVMVRLVLSLLEFVNGLVLGLEIGWALGLDLGSALGSVVRESV